MCVMYKIKRERERECVRDSVSVKNIYLRQGVYAQKKYTDFEMND